MPPSARSARSFGLVTLIGVVTAVIGYLAAPALLRALATPDAAYALAVSYTRVIFLGLPFIFLTVLLSSAMRGVGDAVTPLKAMILNVVIDAGLNPFLIRGWGPFPEMGIAGSATASLIASVVTTLVLIAYIYKRRLPLALHGADMRYLRPNWTLARTIIVKGVPMGLQMVVLSLGMLLMIGLVNRQGVETTAAYGAIGQLWGYIQMPALAIGAGASAMAAQNIGAGKWDRVERTAWAGSGDQRRDDRRDGRADLPYRPAIARLVPDARKARQYPSRCISITSPAGASCCSACRWCSGR